MADIQTYLNDILVATFGEEVRSSIYNSIKSCYEDGKAGKLDLIARDKATALEKTLSDVVSKYNLEANETTLWEGNVYGYGTEITLSQNVSEFDYLDFYFYKDGKTPIVTVKSDESTVAFRDINLPDNAGDSFISASEVSLAINGTAVTIQDQVSYVLIGTSRATVSRVAAQSSTPESMAYLRKIIGRKWSQNLEVIGGRTGYDGVVYNSIGEAIRAQITDLVDKYTQLQQQGVVISADMLEEYVGEWLDHPEVYGNFPTITSRSVVGGTEVTIKSGNAQTTFTVSNGTATDTQVETYINAWLTAHPEATTTVQDGAISTAKLADGAVTAAKLANDISFVSIDNDTLVLG